MQRPLLAVTAAVTATVTALVAGLTPAASGYAADRAPAPAWGPCPAAPPGIPRDPRQQCATLRVPLDYRRPDGRQIDIAVSRIATAKPGMRRGILLFNPGGPGGAGLDWPGQLLPALPAAVTDRFDLIGFDPRGVGHSTPITCGIPADTAPDLYLPYPAPDGSISRNVDFARATAEGCARLSGALLPYITTANTARDMDRIRAALGERKLSYYGLSYGTYLGAVYAALFPQRGDRILLDSAIDPKRVWYDQWRLWAPGLALRLPDFTKWAAARDATYHLGDTPAAVEKTYGDLTGRLDRDPLPTGGYPFTGNLLRLVTFDRLYFDFRFPELATIWQQLASAVSAGTGTGAAPAAVALRMPPGGVDVPAVPPGGVDVPAVPPGGVDVPADNLRSAQYAVLCDDVAWPRDAATYAANVAVDRFLYPTSAGMPANLWPCAFWKYRPVQPPVTVTDRGPRNVLILQNLRDPTTPWASGYGLRQAFGRRAGFVSVDQGGHGVYLLTRSTCANDAATAFLTGGELPERDTLCPGQSAGDVAGPTLGQSAVDVAGPTLASRVTVPGPLG